MKRKLLKPFAILLCLVLLVGLAPAVALAADNTTDSIVSAFSYTGFGGVTPTVDAFANAADRTVTLTFPQSYDFGAHAVNLSSGLVATPAAGVSGISMLSIDQTAATATAGSNTVTIQYAYTKSGTPGTATYIFTIAQSTTSAPATFSGSISKSATKALTNEQDISFIATDFSNLFTASYDSGAFSGISIDCPDTTYGTFKTGVAAPYATGTFVAAANIPNLYFNFSSAPSSAITFYAHAYSASDLTHSTPIGNVPITMTFTAITVPTMGGSPVQATVSTTAAYTFTATDFSSKCSLNNGTLISIDITPTAAAGGAFALNGAPIGGATSVSKAQLDAGQLTYTAGAGTGVATFTWTATNEAGPSVNPGSGVINVTAAAAPTITGSVSKSIYKGVTYKFQLSDFSSYYNLNYGTLSGITITPSATTPGVWHNGAATFTSAGPVTFTPAQLNAGNLYYISDTNAGTASFTWTVATAEGGTSAAGNGAINISGSTAAVSYTASPGTTKVFNDTDFNTASTSATGTGLASITFGAIPTAGTLYTNYVSDTNRGSAITSTVTVFNLASIDSIAFIPGSSTTGTVTIPFNGTTSTGSTFSGNIVISYGSLTAANIPYSTTGTTPVTFQSANFSSVLNAIASGRTLDYIQFTNATTSYGTLTYSGSPVNTTNQYAAATIGSITFTPTGTAGTATYYYTGHATDGTTYTGTVTISVTSTSISYTTTMNTAVNFDYSKFYTAYPTLSTVSFSAPSSGTLTYTYGAYNSSIPVSNLAYVSYTPATSYSGTVYVYFTGTLSGGGTVSGTVTITVGSTSGVSYTTAVNTAKAFDYSTFISVYPTLSTVTFGAPSSGTLSYTYGTYYSSIPVTNLGYVTYTPASGYTGTVTISFTGYLSGGSTVYGTVTITVGSSGLTYTTAVNTSVNFDYSKFYAAYPTLSTVTFSAPSSGTLSYSYGTYYSSIPVANLAYVTYTPASGFTGTVSIPFSGYLSGGSTVYGTVTVTVGSSSAISYTTAKNTAVTFSDFYSKFYSATGYNLYYLTFQSLPSSSYGTLYRDYATYNTTYPVAASTNIYGSSSTPLISNVAFVPYSNYTGTVTLYFTAVTTSSTTITGTVTINVGTSGLNVAYSTAKNTAKTFSSTDFSTAFTTANPGYTLSYVKFTLPTATYGTLYTGYTSSTSLGTAVSAATAYYNTSSNPLISAVTFVPYSNYSGTVTINFTAYSTTGTAFAGTVTINVAGTVTNINLTTNEDTAVQFNSTTFNSVCQTATGTALSYVKFTLPSSSYGSLIYYTGSGTKSGVSPSTSYYVSSSPYLSYISFVPADNYTGSVTITYTGYTTGGTSYTGKIYITVNNVAGSSYFTDVTSSYDWAADAIDTLYQKNIVTGTGNNLFNPSANISRGDFILMLSRALNFTGTPSSMFSDVPSTSYYYNAISAAKAMGIAQGNNNKFNPTGALTRQDAMVLIYRAMKETKHYLTDGSSTDVSRFSDTSKISSYALTAAQTLVKAGIITGSDGKLNPLGSLSRAEMAVILYRVVQMI